MKMMQFAIFSLIFLLKFSCMGMSAVHNFVGVKSLGENIILDNIFIEILRFLKPMYWKKGLSLFW